MKNIGAKMALAMKQIDAVTKGGHNDRQNYNYVRAADVANEVRRALTKVGIVFSYEVLNERFWDAETKNGGIQFFCSIQVRGTFIDPESGETLTSVAMGWGADSQDKAPYKAMTGALKYLLRMTFLIPDEMDPENSQNEPEETASTSTPKAKRITKKQRDEFIAAVKAGGRTGEVKAFLKRNGFESSGEITTVSYGPMMDWAKAKGTPTEFDGGA